MVEVGDVSPGRKTEEAFDLSNEISRLKGLLKLSDYPNQDALKMALIKAGKSSLYPQDSEVPSDAALVERINKQYKHYEANPRFLDADLASIAR